MPRTTKFRAVLMVPEHRDGQSRLFSWLLMLGTGVRQRARWIVCGRTLAQRQIQCSTALAHTFHTAGGRSHPAAQNPPAATGDGPALCIDIGLEARRAVGSCTFAAGCVPAAGCTSLPTVRPVVESRAAAAGGCACSSAPNMTVSSVSCTVDRCR